MVNLELLTVPPKHRFDTRLIYIECQDSPIECLLSEYQLLLSFRETIQNDNNASDGVANEILDYLVRIYSLVISERFVRGFGNA